MTLSSFELHRDTVELPLAFAALLDLVALTQVRSLTLVSFQELSRQKTVTGYGGHFQ